MMPVTITDCFADGAIWIVPLAPAHHMSIFPIAWLVPKYLRAALSEITADFRLCKKGASGSPATSGSRIIWKKLGLDDVDRVEELAIARRHGHLAHLKMDAPP